MTDQKPEPRKGLGAAITARLVGIGKNTKRPDGSDPNKAQA